MDSLSTFLPIDRRQALAQGQILPDRATGAALFADISGFTPLTQALAEELGRQRGPEELALILNRVYTPLIDEIHRYGGSIVGFAGDAITCWFDNDDGWRATTSGLALQTAMRPFAQVPTPGGSTHALSIKVAVVTGPVRRLVVGDPNIQLLDTLAGATLDRMAAGEHMAERGDVLVAQAIVERHAGRIEISAWRDEPATAERFGVVTALTEPTQPTPWPEIPPIDQDAIRSWLLPAVYRQLAGRQEGFWAELRPAVPIFIRFTGIDYDGDDDAGQKLDAFIRWVQSVLAEFEGVLLEVTIGDKGSYLYAAFGTPIAHDDDPARASAAALRLRDLPLELSFIENIQIGITTGQVRAGAYGADSRRTFGMQGNEINMAARLMSKATPGQILVSEGIADRAGKRFRFNALEAIAVKGSNELIEIAELTGEQVAMGWLFDSPLVGREDVLAELGHLLDQARAGRGCVVRIEGPAGVGKSHLLAAIVQEANAAGWRVALGTGQSTAQGIPYFSWRTLYNQLLDLPFGAEQNAAAALTASLRVRLEALNPDWVIRLPLLGDLLGVPIPDNAVTVGFDPRLRREALFSLVVDLVQAMASRRPLLLVLDDVHWLEENSLELASAVARGIEQSQAALLLAHRPPLQAGQAAPAPEISHLQNHHYVDLGELRPDAVAALVANQLGGPASPLAQALIQAKAQGNPFFVNELVDALREAGQLVRLVRDEHLDRNEWVLSEAVFTSLRDAGSLSLVAGEWRLAENAQIPPAALGIPDTIQGVVLSRIDRLREDQKLTLKVASVIGRIFGLDLLHAAHPDQPSFASLQQQVEYMDRRDFVKLETPEPQVSYIFRHNITQEVTYETLLFAQRRQLHQAVAAWYERSYDGPPLSELTMESPLAPHFSLLAHHWRHAEIPDRERVYDGLAGEQAARQYANSAAVAYFSRALQLTPDDEAATRFDLLLKREEVFERQGRRQAQAQDLSVLTDLAEDLGDTKGRIETGLRRANLARLTGDYTSALLLTQETEALAKITGDAPHLARCYVLRSRILAQQDEYKAAQGWLRQAVQAAELAQDLPLIALSIYDLATATYLQGQFELARQHIERAMALYVQISDRRGEANCLRMLGVIEKNQSHRFEAARGFYEQALAICRQIGWLHGETYLLANLGNNLFDLGDYPSARRYHLQALAIRRKIGDREGESVCLDTLGLVAALLGETHAALSIYQQALDIAREIGYLRGEAFVLTHMAYALSEQRERGGKGRTHLAAAEAAFQQALGIRQEISPDSGLIIDDLAGLSRVALLGGDVPKALSYTEEMLAWIEIRRRSGDQLGTEGVELPGLAYLICFQALHAAGDSRAAGILQKGRDEILQAADQIQDETERCLFLEQVPWNRDLIAGLSQPS